MQRVEDRIDVQGLKGALVGQSSLFMSNVQSPVVEPDVCLNRHCAD